MNVASKPLQANNATPSPLALAKALQILGNAGQLRSLRVANCHATDTIYVQLHDAASAPAEGTVPLVSIPLVAGAYYESDTPLDVTTGLYLCASSTRATKTLMATDNLLIVAGKN
jgi:hypothetical protein